jgi:cholesterol oxidase
MNSQKPYITFTETMMGPLALDESDPLAGERKGKAERSVLVFHADILIEDIDRFIQDDQHEGSITGDITFPAFGKAIPSTSGRFNLFSLGGEPKLKQMIYEQGFDHDGRSYYVAGHKNVRDDPGADLWTDTTTLYTTLHEGRSKQDPVIGAGILRLDMKEFMRILSTIRVSNAPSAANAAKQAARFGRFFLGELWDTYRGV